MNANFHLRAMKPDEWNIVAELIYRSTNCWYERAGKSAIFGGEPKDCLLFCEVYEDLDPGCCVVAEDLTNGKTAGSCFYHPRESHVSLGIMNVHPDYFGRGIASRLLRFITGFADRQHKPLRLVSSAMNLDSFSLYTRAGFSPRAVFADMLIPDLPDHLPISPAVRDATAEDAAQMAEMERDISGISRVKDFRYFIENKRKIWHVSVFENSSGGIDGFLCSVNHQASNMLGPGAMRNEQVAISLIAAELNHYRGRTPVFLVPADKPNLVRQIYSWGGRNCEIHFSQARGQFTPFQGIVMPTFMPETG